MASAESQEPSIDKIRALLKAKDDTSRFVGLALLKSVIDNTPEIRQDGQAILSLWESISPKFLDRLLRTGAAKGSSSSRDMLDLAVSVLHAFVNLLPDQAKTDPAFVGRVPRLVSCLVHSSGPTEEHILQTLLSLVSREEGALVLAGVDDLSPLTEIAPSRPMVLDILSFAWLQAMAAEPGRSGALSVTIDRAVEGLVSSFKGTDGVTLLAFVARLLPRMDPKAVPPNPQWIRPLVGFVRNLVASRPTSAGRAAYTNLAAALLQAYPVQAAPLLFSGDAQAEKPFPYLLTSLVLIDIRSSIPTLLAELNSPSYLDLSTRLASAFDIVSHFIFFLVRSLDDPPPSSSSSSSSSPPAVVLLPPDRLLALRKSISETMSVTIEYLRDRWDASVAGAMGLHPDARAGSAPTAAAAALAWDDAAGTDSVAAGRDALVLAALRALAVWIREDDNDMLRREAAGLLDMFVDLYRMSGNTPGALDFRRPVLIALEGITAAEGGIEALLDHDGWEVLSEDMLSILQETGAGTSSPSSSTADAASRGIDIVRVLLPVAEAERPGTREVWLDVVTRIAAWAGDGGDGEEADGRSAQPAAASTVDEFQVAVLQLATTLLAGAHPRVRKTRYEHTTGAVLGVAERLRRRDKRKDGTHGESLDDVIDTLRGLG